MIPTLSPSNLGIWACPWPQECLGKQEVHPSEAPKRSLRELQDVLFRFPTFSPSNSEVWACPWPRASLEPKGLHYKNLGFGAWPLLPGSPGGKVPASNCVPLGRAANGEGDVCWKMQDSCTLCKGIGSPLFRAPRLFNGNPVSGAPADFTDFAPVE